ncbi:hypothetical protein Pst134EA_025654 [Puccinia striiformis f. sp. tritici]|nr:hypothetical protein Pst134EA_025654 [Puccinia striiformis f. sp. tritici]KAH9451714.1 hypothetical protein Pst134EA_025654 [Puccinia striiformis f. sp. tritici]
MSQWKRLGDKINYREVEDPGLDLSLSLSLGTGENRLKTHEQKQPRTDSSEFRTSNRASRSVASCRSKILADIDIWKNDFEKLELDRPEDKSHVQAHVEVVIKSVENLFHERLHEEDERQHIFEGYPIANAVHYQSQGNEHVSEAIPTKNYFPHNVLEGEYIHGSRTGHLSSGQFRNSRKEWLKSIAEVGKIWNTSRSPDLPLRLPMIRRWFDLMMNVIVELQKHQILSNAYLSHFLNEEDRGQFILRYVATKSYPTEISSVYVNFNQKLSLLEDPSMAKMVNIFQALNGDTWRKIEFQYVVICLDRYRGITRSPTPEFSRISNYFLRLVSLHPGQAQIGILHSMKPFFESLTRYMSSLIMSHTAPATDGNLLELKILYDIRSFIIKNHEHHLPAGFLKEFESTSEFYKIRIFEETIGMIASTFHSMFIRSKEFLQRVNRRDGTEPNISERILELCQISKSLSDSNLNRQISSFDKSDQDEEVMSIIRQSHIYKMETKRYKSSLPFRSDKIQDSVHKCVLQYHKYISQLTINAARQPINPPPTLFLATHAYMIVSQKLKDFDLLISVWCSQNYKYLSHT